MADVPDNDDWLSEREKQKVDEVIKQKLGNKSFILVEPNCKKDLTPNKEWFFVRWEELVNKLNVYFLENN